MEQKRYSRQRELIYDCLRGMKIHPTAEMIYQTLKPEHPKLSLGTVYRNLNQLADWGVITRMPFHVERYDADITPTPISAATGVAGCLTCPCRRGEDMSPLLCPVQGFLCNGRRGSSTACVRTVKSGLNMCNFRRFRRKGS